MKNGTLVEYRDSANRKRQGRVSRRSDRTGRRMYRVNDQWFERGDLTVLPE